jgi:hypothetical protein
MKKIIKEDVVCCEWSYEYDELNELKVVLRELSDYYEADLDIETMINSLPKKDPMWNIQYCYLVITVAPIKLLYVNLNSN